MRSQIKSSHTTLKDPIAIGLNVLMRGVQFDIHPLSQIPKKINNSLLFLQYKFIKNETSKNKGIRKI